MNALALSCLVTVSVAAYALADQPHVQPYSQASPSGEWRLAIDPSDPEGAGPARYRMARAGENIYDVELKFTLRQCVVTDAGLALGYAYDTGYMGWSGNLIIFAIMPDGAMKLADSLARDGPAMYITPPPPGEPRGEGVLLDPTTSRIIVRLARSSFDETPVEWRIYSADDATSVAPQKPGAHHTRGEGFSRQINAAVIPDTGLIAVQWMVWHYYNKSAVFELLDTTGASVWSRRINNEYNALGERWDWWDLVDQQIRQLETGPSTVAITSYANAKRTGYTVAKSPDGTWVITEGASAPATPVAMAATPVPIDITVGEIEDLGVITLGPPGVQAPIDGINSLTFDGAGRIAWVRWDEYADPPRTRFMLVTREGEVVTDLVLDLPPVRSAGLPECLWLEGDRWLIARDVYQDGASTTGELFFFDAAVGTLQPLEVPLGAVERLCRLPDAGFVILSRTFGNYTIRDGLTRFNRDGKVVTATLEPGYGRGDNIQDIAVLSDGSLARLIGVGSNAVVKITRPGAANAEALTLSQLLPGDTDREQIYIAGIRADKDAGFILYDSANRNLLHRFDTHGKLWQSFHVSGPNAEQFRLYDAFAVDPDGHVWAADGRRMYRCGPNGNADTALGGPAKGEMAPPVAISVDREGFIYALERCTSAVHVFSPDGEPLRVMRPDPQHAATQDALPWIRVLADGSVRTRMNYDFPILTYNPAGEFVSAETPPDSWRDEAKKHWDQLSAGGWEHNHATLRRRDANGNVIETIRHRPDGAWLIRIDDADTAPDGALAVLSRSPDPSNVFASFHGPMWLSHYAPDGSPKGTVMIEGDSFMTGVHHIGDRILLVDHHSILAFDAAAELRPIAMRYAIGGEQEGWDFMVRPDKTILAWRIGSRAVRRIALRPPTTPAAPPQP